jgi:hypothetical protein
MHSHRHEPFAIAREPMTRAEVLPGWSAGRGRVRAARVNYALLCPRELVDKQMANANLIYFGFRSFVVLNSK